MLDWAKNLFFYMFSGVVKASFKYIFWLIVVLWGYSWYAKTWDVPQEQEVPNITVPTAIIGGGAGYISTIYKATKSKLHRAPPKPKPNHFKAFFRFISSKFWKITIGVITTLLVTYLGKKALKKTKYYPF